jgi:hypothetical protein
MRKLSIILLGLLAVACGQNAPTASPTATPAISQPSQATQAPAPTTPAEVEPSTGYPAYPAPSAPPATIVAPQELVQEAQQRLATRLGIGPEKLSIQAAEAKQWPDTSIGCPSPDTMYQQVIVPGYLLAYSDGSTVYAVHTSLLATPGEPMVWCDKQQPVDLTAAPIVPSPDAQGQAMFELARQDLAKQLGIDPSGITLTFINPVEWNDSSLGCAQPGVNYLQVITPGFLMRLEAQGTTYEYHTDARSAVVRCGP